MCLVCLNETAVLIYKSSKNCSANELVPILKDFANFKNTTIYSYSWKAYNNLMDFGAKAHYRVKHSENKFTNGRNHINAHYEFLDS